MKLIFGNKINVNINIQFIIVFKHKSFIFSTVVSRLIRDISYSIAYISILVILNNRK